jgi:hypothetical protein
MSEQVDDAATPGNLARRIAKLNAELRAERRRRVHAERTRDQALLAVAYEKQSRREVERDLGDALRRLGGRSAATETAPKPKPVNWWSGKKNGAAGIPA